MLIYWPVSYIKYSQQRIEFIVKCFTNAHFTKTKSALFQNAYFLKLVWACVIQKHASTSEAPSRSQIKST